MSRVRGLGRAESSQGLEVELELEPGAGGRAEPGQGLRSSQIMSGPSRARSRDAGGLDLGLDLGLVLGLGPGPGPVGFVLEVG